MAFLPLHIALRLTGIFSRKMKVVKQQIIFFENPLDLPSPIADLGGGGEGVIGQLYGSKVIAIDSRQEELDEIPDGPTKVCADAKDLPFEDNYFGSTTAFYFFMYLKPDDYKSVLKEAYRTLKPGGLLYIWDTIIPDRLEIKKRMYVVPVGAILPNKKIQTAYGVGWAERIMNSKIISDICREVGFIVTKEEQDDNKFMMVCEKPRS